MSDSIVSEDLTEVDFEKDSEVAADFIEGFLDIAELNGDIESGVEDNRPFVRVVYEDGDDNDANYMIGKHGQTLNALQTITRMAVKRSTGNRSSVTVDVAGYLDKKKESIFNYVQRKLDENPDGEVKLRPMNSYDRRLVHHYVAEKGYSTRSEGIEPDRYVTLFKA